MAAPVGRLMAKFRVKSPAELVQRTHQAFVRLPYESQPERTAEELGRLLAALKECMFGDVEEHASRENALAVAREACATGLVSELVEALGLLDFEARKDAADVFCGVMRVGDADGGRPGAAYLEAHPDVVPTLLDGYDRAEVALNCGAMLREAARHEAVAGRLLGDLLDDLLARAQSPEFEVAADAFATLKDALTRHRALAAARLADPGAGVLARYRALLESRDYVTRRQATRLLGQLLCDRANVKAMMLCVWFRGVWGVLRFHSNCFEP
jgi:calcium binding protein 39